MRSHGARRNCVARRHRFQRSLGRGFRGCDVAFEQRYIGVQRLHPRLCGVAAVFVEIACKRCACLRRVALRERNADVHLRPGVAKIRRVESVFAHAVVGVLEQSQGVLETPGVGRDPEAAELQQDAEPRLQRAVGYPHE